MAQAKILTVGGTNYEMIDDTARTNATTALNNAEYNRQGLIGKYPGQSLATLLAGEVSGSATIYDALHKRVQAANFSGMRVGDYIDVPLVSASNVAAQQSVRFLLAHFDPYYQCGDSAKGHHIAFIASAPVAVAKTVTGVANDSYLMWNTANTNQGTADVKNPYLNSNLKAWEKLFEACLPEGLTSTCSPSACCLRSVTARAARSATPTAGAGRTSARCGRPPRWRCTAAQCGAPRATAWASTASSTCSAIPRTA